MAALRLEPAASAPPAAPTTLPLREVAPEVVPETEVTQEVAPSRPQAEVALPGVPETKHSAPGPVAELNEAINKSAVLDQDDEVFLNIAAFFLKHQSVKAQKCVAKLHISEASAIRI